MFCPPTRSTRLAACGWRLAVEAAGAAFLGGATTIPRAPSSLAFGRKPQAASRKPAPSAVLLAFGFVLAGSLSASAKDRAAAGYVGSAVCARCHEEHAGWKQDWHARALSPAGKAFVKGRFDGAHFQGASSEAWLDARKGGGPFTIRVRLPDGGLGRFPLAWVIGGKRMQDAVTVLPDGRWQVLPVYFHVTGGGAWVDYNEAKQGAVGPEHPFYWTNHRRTANRECLDCHTSGLSVTYDRAGNRWSTGFADAAVGCESCHGPGRAHAKSADAADIVQPRKAAPAVGLALCAQCHGPNTPLFPRLDAAHRFRAGQKYEDAYQPLVIVDGRERSGEFFADGRPNTSSIEYQALLQSRCFRLGGATCLTCHTAPHGRHGENELPKAKAGLSAGDSTCQACHAAVFAAGKAHTHHEAAEAQRCLACHMPKLVDGVLDKFADHALDVPVPETTARHGVPNACNGCHAKEAPAAMVAALDRWFPGSRRRERRIRLADAIDEATAGASEPALRAVIADAAEAPSLRAAASVLLAQRFPYAAASAVAPLLREPDALLRAKAAEALSFTRGGDLEPLTAVLGDPSPFVRQAAALALLDRGDPRGEPAARALAEAAETSGLLVPHLALAVLAGRRRDFTAAQAELARALAIKPYGAEVLSIAADLSLQQGDQAAARQRLEELLRLEPHNQAALARQGSLQQGGP